MLASCTTSLFILNLSKNSFFYTYRDCFSKADAKVRQIPSASKHFGEFFPKNAKVFRFIYIIKRNTLLYK